MPGVNYKTARRACVTLAWLALFLPAAAQQGAKQEESSGTLEVTIKKVRAEDLAREFLRDPRQAEKTYISTPKQVKLGKMTGIPVLDPVSGEVEKVQGQDVYLKTGTPKVRVLLRTKKAPPEPLPVGKTVYAAGFVRSYRDGVIAIDVHRIALKPPGKGAAKKP
jgi:hypothetical protein